MIQAVLHAARAWSVLLTLASSAAAEDVPALAAQLNTDRARAAADRLAELGPAAKDAVPQLIVALQAEDRELRWRAAWALSRIGPDAGSAAPALVTVADERDGLPATAARIALKRMGRRATDAVVAAMLRAPEEERARYLLPLQIVEHDPQAVVPLVLPLLSSGDDEAQWRVCKILERMGQGAAAAAPALVRSMREDPSPFAEETLVAIGEPSWAPLSHLAMDPAAPPRLRARATVLLARIGGTGLATARVCLSQALRGKETWWYLRAIHDAGSDAAGLAPLLEDWLAMQGHAPFGAVRALVSMGPAGEAALERLLFTRRTECRANLAGQLGGLKCTKAVPWLFLLAEPSRPREVRHAALRSLAESRLDADQARDAVTLAERALPEDATTACALAGSLGPAGLPLADKLKPLLEHRDPEVRTAAASALCRIGKGGDTEVSVLAEAVKNPSKSSDYLGALRCLAEAGPPAAAGYELLLAALAGKDNWARSIAADGLMRMLPALGEDKQRVLAAVQSSGESVWQGISDVEDVATLMELLSIVWTTDAALDRLVALGSRSWESLSAALDSPDPTTRCCAARALLRIDAESAEDRAWLIPLGSFTDAYEIQDLCLGQPQVAIPHLMKALAGNDPTARGSAARLLGELKHRDSAPVLRAMVAHDADQEARCYALWALDLLAAQ